MNSRRTFLPDAAGLWGLVIFVTLTLVGSNKALNDGDTLWHIKMGQVMLERGEVLTHDIFSHTAYGQPWHAHEWLSEIIMAFLYNGAGLPGVTIFYFAIVGLTFTLIFKVASRVAGDGSACVAMAAASEPASGSDRARAISNRPATSFGSISLLCASLP